MSFVHFTLGSSFHSPRKEEKIVIHLQDPIFIEEELEEHIRKALKDGTFERTEFIVPSVMDLNLITGKGSPKKLISDESLSTFINHIVKKIKGEGYE